MKLIFIYCIAFFSCEQLYSQEDLAYGLESTCDSVAYRYMAPGSPAISMTRTRNPLPKADLSRYLPYVGDQGLQWSCTAFSVAAALTILDNQEKGKVFAATIPGAKDYNFSPAFVFNVAKSKYPNPRRSACNVGISYIDAFLVVLYHGMVTYKDLDYDGGSLASCGKPVDDQTIKKAGKTKILTFQKPEMTNEVFKALLSDPGYCYPINISVNIDSKYKNAGKYNEPWKESSVITGQHAMCIVGYDDGKKAFKVLDSRGTNWGDKGYIWIGYSLMQNRAVVFDAYVCSFDDKILRDMQQPGDAVASTAIKDTNWVKGGYYQPFNRFRIACAEINKKTKVSKILIRDLATGNELTSIGAIALNDTKRFEVPGGYIDIEVYDISTNRGLTTKPAAEFYATFYPK